MTRGTAYREGFRKAAADAGLNPDALEKLAFWGTFVRIAPKIPAAFNRLRGIIPAFRTAVKKVPGATTAYRAAQTAAKNPVVRTTAIGAGVAGTGFIAGRLSAGTTSSAQQNEKAEDSKEIDWQDVSPDYLSRMRTADWLRRVHAARLTQEDLYRQNGSMDSGYRNRAVFNYRPYIPDWERQAYKGNL